MAFATLAEAKALDAVARAAGELTLCVGVPVEGWNPDTDETFEYCAHCGTRPPEVAE